MMRMPWSPPPPTSQPALEQPTTAAVFQAALERGRETREDENALRARIIEASWPHLLPITEVTAMAHRAGVEIAVEHSKTAPTATGYVHTVRLTGAFAFLWEFHHDADLRLVRIHVPPPAVHEAWKYQEFREMTLAEVQVALPRFLANQLGEIAGRLAADQKKTA